uniref:CSON002928 protein n=1 Tax=Culicoides sonorensis TaxID=179676 RepID=A0A336LI25_CULSO
MPRPTTTGVFHQYLEMIGQNEPITRKARFWSSYVRGLGGSEAIVGRPKRGGTEKQNILKSCESTDKPIRERVAQQGYHYQPLYRNIYGHSPRKTGLKSIYA